MGCVRAAIGVNMNIGANAARGRDAAVVSDNDAQPIFVHHMDWDAIKQIAVLSKYECFGAFADDGGGGQHYHVLKFFERNLQPNALTRAKPPGD